MLLRHAVGSKTPKQAMVQSVLLGCAAIGVAAEPALSASGDSVVELNAVDGSAVIKGQLLEVSHGSYVVKTTLGTLRIGIEDAECIGASCPTLDRFDSDFAVKSSSVELNAAMQTLLSSYADQLEAGYEILSTGESQSEVAIVDEASNRRLASIDLGLNDPNQDIDPSDLLVFAKHSEADNAAGDGEIIIALDGVALIVHQDSAIDVLNARAVASVFACEDDDVEGLTASDRPSNIFVSPRDSDTYAAFKAAALDPFGVELCDDAVHLSSDDDVAAAVANNRDAIGLVSLSHVNDAKSVPIAECNLVHEPSMFAVKAGDYPLARRILLKAPAFEESSGAVQRFIDFALSDVGQDSLEEQGLIGLNLDSTHRYPSRYRLARIEAATNSFEDTYVVGRLLDLIQDAVRLSATFHFTSGAGDVGESHRLQDRAQRDLTRVISYLQSSAPLGTEVLVLGFADASGDYGLNLDLSRQRAQSVADKLASLGVPISAVEGFGEEAPVACNSDKAGRAQNRRVEIWLRFPEKLQSSNGTRITM